MLGAGGFATVYLAYDPRLDGLVAVKVLADNWTHDPEVRRRFRSEAVLLRRVQQEAPVPGVVDVFDIGQGEDGRPFFVMSYADRGTLLDRAEGRAWRPADVLPVVHELATTVGALHAAGVVHRDLKPSNLMLRTDRSADRAGSRLIQVGERLVVGDLGLAKDLESDFSALSIAGGTGRYVAPEQLSINADIDARADVHAASVLVAELLAGPDMPTIDTRDESAPPPGTSPEVWGVLTAGMSPDRTQRPDSMQAWRTQLDEAFAADSSATDHREPVTEASSPRRRRVVFGGIIVAILAAGGLGLALTGDDGLGVSGPDRVFVGESARYTTNALDQAAVVWTDWNDEEIATPELDVLASLPGSLTFSVVAGTESATRTITVEASDRSPGIVGPDVLTVGESARYTATLTPDDRSHFWIAPGGERFDGGELDVTARSAGTLVVSLVAVGDDGISRGNRLLVTVR